MRIQFRDSMALFEPGVNITMANAKKISEVLNINIPKLKSINSKALLFSLQGVDEFDLSGRGVLINSLKNLQNVAGISVGIIDYPEEWFEDLKDALKNSSISLFKNFEIAYLLLSPKKSVKYSRVYLYESDDTLRELFASELRSKGFKVEEIRDKSEFLKKSKNCSSDSIFISHTVYDTTQDFIPIRIEDGVVTYLMPQKIESLSKNFNLETHQRRVKDGYRLFLFDFSQTQVISPNSFEYLISLSLNGIKHNSKLLFCGLLNKFCTPIMLSKFQKSSIAIYEDKKSALKDRKIEGLKNKKEPSGLTKKLISSLPLFVNAALETFQSLTGFQAQKRAHKISSCSLESHKEIVASSLAFSGEISGSLMLIFSQDIAKKISKALIGEEIDDIDELQDSVGEFVNIISGRVKALLAEHDYHITIKIPKLFSSKKSVSDFLENRNGVQIELLIDGDLVVLFLTY